MYLSRFIATISQFSAITWTNNSSLQKDAPVPLIWKSPSYQQNHFHMLLAVSPHLHTMQVSLNRALWLGVCDANLFAAERRNNFYSPALRLTSRASGADRVGARVCISLSLSRAPEETLDSLGRKLIIRYLLSCVSRLSHNIKKASWNPARSLQFHASAGRRRGGKQHRALERVNYFLCAPSVRQRNTQIYLFTMCTHIHTRGQGIMAPWPRGGGGVKEMDGSGPHSLFTSRLWCRCALHPHAHLTFLIILSFDSLPS